MRIEQPIDARLEAAAIHRRVLAGRRARTVLRQRQGLPLSDGQQSVRHAAASAIDSLGDTLERVRQLIELKSIRGWRLRSPWNYLAGRAGPVAHAGRAVSAAARPRPARSTIDELPQLQSWPLDGGPFITLPQVYTEDADAARPAPLEPGHVPRSNWPAASTSRIRKSACTIRFIAASACTMRRRFGPGPAAARERLRRRHAGHDVGRRDAAARGNERAVRLPARWPAIAST